MSLIALEGSHDPANRNEDDYGILSNAEHIEKHLNLLFDDDDPVLIWQKGEHIVTLLFENKRHFLRLLRGNKEFLEALSHADTYVAIAILDKERLKKELKCEPLPDHEGIYHCKGRNRSEHAKGVRVLVLDFDCRDCEDEVKKFCEFLNERNFSYSLASSGRGFHLYVKLNSALPPAQWRQLQETFIEVAKQRAPGVDEKVKDPARVMRLVGTYNWKEDQPRESYWIVYNPYPPILSDQGIARALMELLGKGNSHQEKVLKKEVSSEKFRNGGALICKDLEKPKPEDDLSKVLELLPPAEEVADGRLNGNVPFFGNFATSRHEIAMNLACMASLAGIERERIEEVLARWLNDDSKFRVIKSSQVSDQYKVCKCNSSSSRSVKAVNAFDTKLFSSIYLFLLKRKGLSEGEALIEASKRVAQIEELFGLRLKSRRNRLGVPQLTESLEIELCEEYPVLKLYAVAKLGQSYSKRVVKETLERLGWGDLFPVSQAPFRIHLNEDNVVRFLIERYSLDEGAAKSLIERIRNAIRSGADQALEEIEGFNNVFLLDFSKNVTMVASKSKRSKYVTLMPSVPRRLYVFDDDNDEEYLIELIRSSDGKEVRFGPSTRKRIIENLRSLNVSNKRNVEAIFNDLIESLLRGSSKKVEIVRAPWFECGVYWYKGRFVAYGLNYKEEEVREALELLLEFREHYLDMLDVFWSVVKWGLTSRLFYALKKKYYESVPMILLTGRSRAGKSSLARIALAIGGGEEKKVSTKASLANALNSSITPLLLDEAEDVLRRVREEADWMSIFKSIFSEDVRTTAFGSSKAKRTVIMSANEEYFFIPQLARRIAVVRFPEIERKGSREFDRLFRVRNKLGVLGLWASDVFIKKELWKVFEEGGWKALADSLIAELLREFGRDDLIDEALQWRIYGISEQKELERDEVLIMLKERIIEELTKAKQMFGLTPAALQSMIHFKLMLEEEPSLFLISGTMKLLKELKLQLTPSELAEIVNGEFYERKKINGKSLRSVIVVKYEELPEQLKSVIEQFLKNIYVEQRATY